MAAPMKAPTSIRWPLTVQPRPLPAAPPPPAALTNGVMTLSVKALISVLKARATTRPTATTISWPCIRKFLKPLSIAPPRHAVFDAHRAARCHLPPSAPHGRRTRALGPVCRRLSGRPGRDAPRLHVEPAAPGDPRVPGQRSFPPP